MPSKIVLKGYNFEKPMRDYYSRIKITPLPKKKSLANTEIVKILKY